MKGRQGFTPAQKQMMELSRETLEGLRMTGTLYNIGTVHLISKLIPELLCA